MTDLETIETEARKLAHSLSHDGGAAASPDDVANAFLSVASLARHIRITHESRTATDGERIRMANDELAQVRAQFGQALTTITKCRDAAGVTADECVNVVDSVAALRAERDTLRAQLVSRKAPEVTVRHENGGYDSPIGDSKVTIDGVDVWSDDPDYAAKRLREWFAAHWPAPGGEERLGAPLRFSGHVDLDDREPGREERKAKEAPVCSTCNDTHRMPFHLASGDLREVMCTRCPRPCQKCREAGFGAFCETTPCPCTCHGKPAEAQGAVGDFVRVSGEDLLIGGYGLPIVDVFDEEIRDVESKVRDEIEKHVATRTAALVAERDEARSSLRHTIAAMTDAKRKLADLETFMCVSSANEWKARAEKAEGEVAAAMRLLNASEGSTLAATVENLLERSRRHYQEREHYRAVSESVVDAAHDRGAREMRERAAGACGKFATANREIFTEQALAAETCRRRILDLPLTAPKTSEGRATDADTNPSRAGAPNEPGTTSASPSAASPLGEVERFVRGMVKVVGCSGHTDHAARVEMLGLSSNGYKSGIGAGFRRDDVADELVKHLAPLLRVVVAAFEYEARAEEDGAWDDGEIENRLDEAVREARTAMAGGGK